MSNNKKGSITTADRLSSSELHRLTDNLKHTKLKGDKKMRVAILLQYYTSLRFSDCCRITFDDIINNNQFRLREVKTKRKKGHAIIHVQPELKEIIEEYYATIDVSIDSVIVPFSVSHANKQLKKYRLRHDVKSNNADSKFNFSTHTIRKTSLYEIDTKKGMKTGISISGHTSVKDYQRYVDSEEDRKEGYMCLQRYPSH